MPWGQDTSITAQGEGLAAAAIPVLGVPQLGGDEQILPLHSSRGDRLVQRSAHLLLVAVGCSAVDVAIASLKSRLKEKSFKWPSSEAKVGVSDLHCCSHPSWLALPSAQANERDLVSRVQSALHRWLGEGQYHRL